MSDQLTLLDIPPVNSTRRKPAPRNTEAETIHQTLARYAREAAEIRAQLRQAQIKEDLNS